MKQQQIEKGDRAESQPGDDALSAKVTPDYQGYNGIREVRGGLWDCLVQLLRNRGILELALVGSLVCLGYIGTRIVAAGDRLTTMNLIGGLVVAGMVFVIGLLPLAAAVKKDATNPEESAHAPTEPGDERRSSQET